MSGELLPSLKYFFTRPQIPGYFDSLKDGALGVVGGYMEAYSLLRPSLAQSSLSDLMVDMNVDRENQIAFWPDFLDETLESIRRKNNIEEDYHYTIAAEAIRYALSEATKYSHISTDGLYLQRIVLGDDLFDLGDVGVDSGLGQSWTIGSNAGNVSKVWIDSDYWKKATVKDALTWRLASEVVEVKSLMSEESKIVGMVFGASDKGHLSWAHGFNVFFIHPDYNDGKPINRGQSLNKAVCEALVEFYFSGGDLDEPASHEIIDLQEVSGSSEVVLRLSQSMNVSMKTILSFHGTSDLAMFLSKIANIDSGDIKGLAEVFLGLDDVMLEVDSGRLKEEEAVDMILDRIDKISS